jgi:nitrite reductase/ring-hydroxylating ferredoxin subunit
MTTHEPIIEVDDVPSDSSVLFRVRDRADDELQEAILIATDDGIACWLNSCQHMRHIPLDKGSGAPIRDGEIVCANHGAMFAVDTGECTYGPCEGAYLQAIDVTLEGDRVYLDDQDYTFEGLGGIEDDDDDLSSSSNVIL